MRLYAAYSIPLLATGLCSLALAGYVWKRRAVPGAFALLSVLIAITHWCVACTFELYSPDVAGRLLWCQIELPAIAALPACFLILSIQYSGYSISPRWIAALFTVPALVQPMAWSGLRYGLYFRRMWIETGPLPLTGIDWGPGFWLLVANTYIGLLFSIVLIVHKLIQSGRKGRAQIAIFLTAALTPIAVNVADICELLPKGCPDLTPFALAITAAGFAWILFRYRFQAIVPVAWKSVVESMEDGVIVLDSERRVLSTNPAADQVLQLSSQEVIGRLPEAAFANCPALIPFSKVNGLDSDITVGEGDGEQIFEVRTFDVRDRREETVCSVLTVRDVTAERRVAQELEVSRKAADAANQAKSEFLANMSHEIRTPMNGVLGMIELALGTELNLEQQEFIETARLSADALLTVINDILDFSKIEAGKLEFDPVACNLRTTLAQVTKPLALRAGQKGLELLCDVRPGVPDYVVSDPTRLAQIITNLVGNAIKFTSQGEVELCVDLEGVENERANLHFSVRDTGIGIAQEKQKAIFEAFSQADTATTRKFGGTGLGLSICRRLVEMMGGKIWVESEPGAGSKFHFTVLAPAAQPAQNDAPVNTTKLEGVPVLIVDDNAVSRRILGEMLETVGMKPIRAGNAAEALRTLLSRAGSGNAYKVALLDSDMPEVDGFALVAQIRQQERLAGTELVLLTSAGQPGDAARCRALGIGGCLSKPIFQFQLVDAIQLALGHKEEAPVSKIAMAAPSGIHGPAGLSILLAEDNPVNQKVARRLLEKQGHFVTVAGNGREAVLACERGSFDLLLMDIQMPEMDGIEATAAIRHREHSSGQHTPIIALTAHAMIGDREHCLAAGMDGYVTKPIRMQELMAEIRRLEITSVSTLLAS